MDSGSSKPCTLDLTTQASTKALARDRTLSFETYSASPSLQPDTNTSSEKTNRLSGRGVGDSIATVALHHDESVHNLNLPASGLAIELYNEMERLRCESIGAVNMLGVSRNLANLWHEDLSVSDANSQFKVAAACLTRKALQLNVTVTDQIQHCINQWEAPLLKDTQPWWPQLFDARFDQRHYSEIANKIVSAFESNDSPKSDSASQPFLQKPNDDSEDDEEQDVEEQQDNLDSVEQRDSEESTAELLIKNQDSFSYDQDNTKNRDAPVETGSESTGAELTATAPYASYSTRYDEIVSAQSICDARELQALRVTLDNHIEQHNRIVGKLAGQLQRILMAQQNRSWSFDLEEGLLDASRLTRIVTQPYSGLSFKQEKNSNFKDTAVTLLVDNSKSMLGKPIATAAACADILSQTLERCGVTVEILGFTTTELHGGDLYNLWKSEGRANNPGRLNGLRHIIYKSADTPYRRARSSFGLMLHKDLLKQNIDGEALLWASKRLQQRPEERKILLIISDGAPIDTSTMSANRDNYLIDHLHEVIGSIEKRGTIELAAVGIGHDVAHYYQRAITIMDVRDLGRTLLHQFKSLFPVPGRRNYH